MNPTSAPPIPSTGTCANCRQQRIAVRAIKSGDLPLCHHCLEQAALIFTPRNHFSKRMDDIERAFSGPPTVVPVGMNTTDAVPAVDPARLQRIQDQTAHTERWARSALHWLDTPERFQAWLSRAGQYDEVGRVGNRTQNTLTRFLQHELVYKYALVRLHVCRVQSNSRRRGTDTTFDLPRWALVYQTLEQALHHCATVASRLEGNDGELPITAECAQGLLDAAREMTRE
jgi:hypothetical protein